MSFISICTVCPSIPSLNGNNSQYKHYCKHFSLPFLVFIYIAFESMNNATDNTLPNSMGCDWPFCEDGGCHKNDFGIFWPFLQLVGNYKITIDRTDRDMLYERREIKKRIEASYILIPGNKFINTKTCNSDWCGAPTDLPLNLGVPSCSSNQWQAFADMLRLAVPFSWGARGCHTHVFKLLSALC